MTGVLGEWISTKFIQSCCNTALPPLLYFLSLLKKIIQDFFFQFRFWKCLKVLAIVWNFQDPRVESLVAKVTQLSSKMRSWGHQDCDTDEVSKTPVSSFPVWLQGYEERCSSSPSHHMCPCHRPKETGFTGHGPKPPKLSGKTDSLSLQMGSYSDRQLTQFSNLV